jgi:hypothetical protein
MLEAGRATVTTEEYVKKVRVSSSGRQLVCRVNGGHLQHGKRHAALGQLTSSLYECPVHARPRTRSVRLGGESETVNNPGEATG